MRVSWFLFVLCGLVTGCTHPQRPIQFSATGRGDDTVDRLSRALAAEGQSAASTDRAAGIIHTGWQDTGFGYGQLNGARATIVRRYVVVVTPGANQSEVTVRADTVRCAQDGTIMINATDVRGTCEAMSDLVAAHQQDLDALGARLQRAMGHGAP